MCCNTPYQYLSAVEPIFYSLFCKEIKVGKGASFWENDQYNIAHDGKNIQSL